MEAVGNFLNWLHFGPHERKVKAYLDKATPNSVLEDLTKELTSRLSEVRGLWMTFDACCVRGSSEQRYWNEDSLRKHVEATHPEISEFAVPLLWRCLHFYAYHPFPRDAPGGRIDAKSFQRAASLLAGHGTDLLGTQEADYFWRYGQNDAFFRNASFERIFRSIGFPDVVSPECAELDRQSISIVNDTMDVLATTQPWMVCLAPSPDQLELAARKLLAESSTPKRYRVAREDLSTLLSLLLQLRRRKAKWRSRFHLGSFDKSDPHDIELADILVNGLGGNQDDQSLTPDQVLRAIDMLPTLQFQFHQLWAVLFQPAMAVEDYSPSQKPDTNPSRIFRAISLFIPQPVIFSRSHATTQDMWSILENSTRSSERSDEMTVTRLIKSLAQDPHPYLVLITGDKTDETPLTVVGAYFPGPLWLKADGGGEKLLVKAGTSHLLFQLEPIFRLLQWSSPNVPLIDIINLDYDAPSLQDIAAGDDTLANFHQPYRIGAPDRRSVGLRIDPQTKSALLTAAPSSAPTGTGSGEVTWYRDVGRDGGSCDNIFNKNWEVAIKVNHFEIFNVLGSVDSDITVERIIKEMDQTRYIQDATKSKVEGEELKKRIQGFGST